ncbi:unnamed protein product [Adineta ricciae]|uniref:Uncharacterized protein n=1 Tax=Adineta ricciae TaxID=249248 RepID=A0A814WAT0_ADIRI|nr:unnamed protein product [Adineta ricciae]
MADKSATRSRRTGGVRFSNDTTDSSDDHEEHPSRNEFDWEENCANECSFDLYFGILKLSHIYSMTFHIIFRDNPVELESIVDHHDARGLQLTVNKYENSHSDRRVSYEVELVINADIIPGPFHRTFLLKEVSQKRSVTVNVKGKILRENQGTAILRHAVHIPIRWLLLSPDFVIERSVYIDRKLQLF